MKCKDCLYCHEVGRYHECFAKPPAVFWIDMGPEDSGPGQARPRVFPEEPSCRLFRWKENTRHIPPAR